MSNWSKGSSTTGTGKNQFSKYAAGGYAGNLSDNVATGFDNARKKESIPYGLTNGNAENGIGCGTQSNRANVKSTSGTKGSQGSCSWMSRKRIGIDDEEIKRDAQRAKLERRRKYQKGNAERAKVIQRQIQQNIYQKSKQDRNNKKKKESKKKQQSNSSDDEESFVASTTTEEDIILTSTSEEESLSNNMMEGEDDEDHIDSPKPLPVGRTARNRRTTNTASRNVCDSTRKTSSATAALAVDLKRKEEPKTDRVLLDTSSEDDCHSLLSKPTFIQKNYNQRSHVSCNQTKEIVESKGGGIQPNTQSKRRNNKIIHSSSEDDDEYQLNLRRAMKESLLESKTNCDSDSPNDIPKDELRALKIAQWNSLKDSVGTSNLVHPDATQWLLESTSPKAISNFKRLKKKRISLYNGNSDGHLSSRTQPNSDIRQKKMANKISQKRSDQADDEIQLDYNDYSSDATTSTAHGSDENGIDGISFQGDEGEDGAHEKDEAATVLDTVNELSSRVLYRMQSFCNQLQDHDNRMSSSVQGMIVDGALAMSTFSSRTSITTAAGGDQVAAKDEKALVSREALSKCISSEMVIHDYQLIGVNWMALMNTLECYDKRRGKLGRHRAKSNVNGVLADEMGLVSFTILLFFMANSISWVVISNYSSLAFFYKKNSCC
jgi:hypothetical protein